MWEGLRGGAQALHHLNQNSSVFIGFICITFHTRCVSRKTFSVLKNKKILFRVPISSLIFTKKNKTNVFLVTFHFHHNGLNWVWLPSLFIRLNAKRFWMLLKKPNFHSKHKDQSLMWSSIKCSVTSEENSRRQIPQIFWAEVSFLR